MGIMNFYKSPKPSKFRFTTLYYNPKKEAMQRRIDRARRKYYPEEFAEEDGAEQKDRLREVFHKQSDKLPGYQGREQLRESLQEKNWTLLLILGILLVFFLWLYDNIGFNFVNYLINKYFVS